MSNYIILYQPNGDKTKKKSQAQIFNLKITEKEHRFLLEIIDDRVDKI